MPIYEYSCRKCGKTIEAIQKMSDKPLKTHAGCGGKLTKLISAAGFQFKGTGWYVTDYARKAQPEKAESGKEAKAEASKTTETGKATDAGGNGAKETPASTTEKSEKPAKPSSVKSKKS